MKETTKNTIRKIAKFVAVYYAIEAVVTAVILAVYTAINGLESTKHLVLRTISAMKKFYMNIFHGNFRGAETALNDSVLDSAEDVMRHHFGDDFTDDVMNESYDVLERRNIPFTRKGDFMSHPISESEVPEDIRRRAEYLQVQKRKV